jgi:hypothetical protein
MNNPNPDLIPVVTSYGERYFAKGNAALDRYGSGSDTCHGMALNALELRVAHGMDGRIMKEIEFFCDNADSGDKFLLLEALRAWRRVNGEEVIQVGTFAAAFITVLFEGNPGGEKILGFIRQVRSEISQKES